MILVKSRSAAVRTTRSMSAQRLRSHWLLDANLRYQEALDWSKWTNFNGGLMQLPSFRFVRVSTDLIALSW